MTQLYCPTEQAILLLVVRTGATGLMRLPDGFNKPPGRLFSPRPLLPIAEQLYALAADTLQDPARSALVLEPNYTDRVLLRPELPEDDPRATASLYLVSCELASQDVSTAWPSFPELLRAMPRNRARLPYLRAFQVLAGGLHLNTKAIEAQELAKYFPDDV